ncbi:hypothetical protein KSP24_09285 [Paenibacillus sp. AK121]|uniref:hypothetical protein n=1 Tax=Paenibacillus TaxID=44249 RepID=UPI001C2320AB|nr:hypothetical protein [Paenibacillus sp. AK121]MBU9707116.1 hypothetical protein [Paenibacillus sp. AK121]MEE4566383.1 hypothetical protein [Paenibacillus polymyxa]
MKLKNTAIILSGVLALTAVAPIAASAESSTEQITQNSSSSVTQKSAVEAVKPYVQVKDGVLSLKDVPENIYNQYNLSDLQKHFDELNELSKSGKITVNSDLSIKDNTISLNAEYGSWTYHWWGYDRKFTDSQTKQAIDYYNSVAGGGALVSGATAWYPPVSGISGSVAGYFALFAARMSANNNGNGVYVSVSWAAVFDVEPL